ncbi:MAG: class 1 isoprenoid biosynthesis enzyme [Halobacteriota archaeon]
MPKSTHTLKEKEESGVSLTALRRFYPSIKEHKMAEEEVRRLLHETLDERYIKRDAPQLGMLKYAQKNFFSILFLSIYRALNIPCSRRIMYGMMNHSIRGIVTGTDNILDDEYKELLPLRFSKKATRFKSVMHILLFDHFLLRVLDEAVKDQLMTLEEKYLVQQKIFEALVLIGEEEATEEGGISRILPPAEILSSVHMYKGGNLLRLAFVAPRILEKELSAELEQVDKGVYSIGMALQVIDDLTDFYSDIRRQNHNYLVSSIYFEGTATERKKLEVILVDEAAETLPIEKQFAESVSRVMERAIGEALMGFDRLHDAGYWINRSEALDLIEFLFKVRGVTHLLSLLPKECVITLSAG